MSEKLFEKEPYLKEIEATVVSLKNNTIILDKTIFYPEGGGQPGDKGTFGKYEIVDTKKGDNGEVLHIINGELPKVGEKALLVLDWSHRYHYMREHSAQHLISGLLFNEANIGTLAVHQGGEYFTIETDQGDISTETLLHIEDKANEAIRSNKRIWMEEMSHTDAEKLGLRRSIKVEGMVKVVFIEDIDKIACGGVHLASTSEMEEITYLSKEVIRNHTRTIWLVGEKSKEYRRVNNNILSEVKSLLSSDRDNILSSIELLKNEVAALKKENKELSKLLSKSDLASHIDKNEYIFETSLSLDDYIDFLNQNNLFIINDNKKSFLYFGDKDIFNNLKNKAGLRGGGREPLFRGVYTIEKDALLDIARSEIK